MSPTSYPLTDDHKQQMLNAIDALKQAQIQAERAQRAGIDVAAQLDRIKQLQASYGAIKQEYFPGA